MKPSNNFGFKKVYNSTRYSLYGLRSGWRCEQAFRFEVILAIITFPASFWLAGSFIQWAMMICTSLLVLLTELVNSAIEAVVDRMGDDYNELSGRAKDLGSAAVMMSGIMAAIVWGGSLLIRLGILPAHFV